jgi:hypothetical protein
VTRVEHVAGVLNERIQGQQAWGPQQGGRKAARDRTVVDGKVEVNFLRLDDMGWVVDYERALAVEACCTLEEPH